MIHEDWMHEPVRLDRYRNFVRSHAKDESLEDFIARTIVEDDHERIDRYLDELRRWEEDFPSVSGVE